jgi:putative ATPase
MELFGSKNIPLSKRMMPKTLSEFRGQSHLTDTGKPIRTMLENGIIHSMIFYGPPATGKTSLAQIIASELEYRYIRTNALTLNNDEIKSIIAQGQNRSLAGEKTIVFIDEIHRLIKPKQDAFLSALEEGDIIIIGATTENPYFVMQPALRSRVFVYEFKSLSREDFDIILDYAIENDKILEKLDIRFADNARDYLLDISADPRMLLNTLEMAVLSKGMGEYVNITKDDLSAILQKPDTLYSSEEGHYDVISAFIKSVRGSDIDAAVYYLALMLESGEDPLFIARRLIILASEDIGIAYPEALPVAVACYTAVEKIGMPEARLVLAETTVLLAGVPKSNSAYLAINGAQKFIREGNILPVPPYLKNATFDEEKKMGRGVGYKYPHDYPNHFTGCKYLESDIKFYEAGELGFEKRLKDWMEKIRKKDDGRE